MEPPTIFDALIQRSLHTAQYSLPIDKSSVLSCGLILSVFVVLYSTLKEVSGLPQSNPKHAFELSNARRIREFMFNSIGSLRAWETQFMDQPYRFFCESGEMTMLPFKEIDAIRSDKRFDFGKIVTEDAHGYLPGFEAFGESPAILKVVNKHLTKALTKVTGPLSEEAEIAIRQTFGDSTDWKVHNAPEDIMNVVSRMSSRLFMGVELCSDDNWNAASADYTRKVFSAILALNEKPPWIRPYIHWLMPACWEVRKAKASAQKALEPHLQRREEAKAAALSRGEQSPFNDAIEWFKQEGSTSSPADDQIRLSVVAIHTTSDLLCETIITIAAHPELFQPLREEVVRVLSTYGLKKTALYELQLMDAVFKETQRIKPMLLNWRRKALEDVTLPSGVQIKKGDKVSVSLLHMWDEDHWKDATTFDPYRFIRMRNTPDQSHTAHLVSTSPNHLGFGHGVHACPGRFFASNEVKIALCHLILKYDWKLPEGPRPQPIAIGMNFNTNPKAQLLFRRRKEELNLSELES